MKNDALKIMIDLLNIFLLNPPSSKYLEISYTLKDGKRRKKY